MQKRKAGHRQGHRPGASPALFKAAGVTALQGHGKLLAGNRVEYTAPDGSTQELAAKHVVLASGSQPMALKSLPFDGKHIVDSWGALEFDAVPKRLGVIGAGVIGLELGSVWRRLGAEVVVLEALDQFLRHGRPGRRQGSAQALQEAGPRHPPRRQGQRRRRQEGRRDAEVHRRARASRPSTVDKVVVAIGRRPFTDGLLGDGTGVKLDERGFIEVDDECRTGAGNVWAVGDVVRGPMLAHKGKEEGVMVGDLIAGLHSEVNYDAMPSVIYTAPEIAWVGQTEEQVKASGRAYKVGSFPFMASGRARAMEAPRRASARSSRRRTTTRSSACTSSARWRAS